ARIDNESLGRRRSPENVGILREGHRDDCVNLQGTRHRLLPPVKPANKVKPACPVCRNYSSRDESCYCRSTGMSMSRRVLVQPCRSSLRLAAKLVVLVGLVIAPGSPSLFSQTPSPATSPLDRPLRLIAEARKSFENVQDYTATLVKREQVN